MESVVYIANIAIRNFRGISSLDWSPPKGLTSLIGPGDSCKTTILDAIELVLTPKWNPPVSDNDFFNANKDLMVSIEATMGGLPLSLLLDRKFGQNLRGISPEGIVNDEPHEGDESALTIRFELNSDLEPTWAIVNDRLDEPRTIPARDRAEFGMAQFSGQPNSHFIWGRGSAIMAATSTEEEVNTVMVEAQRQIRDAIAGLSLDNLETGVSNASAAAKKMGAGRVAGDMKAAMSADTYGFRGVNITLHSNGIPLERSGLGTRRLVAIGLQELAIRPGAIILVDEIEGGLEPYRLRHLLRILRDRSSTVDDEISPSTHQAFITTHSPVAIEELGTRSIHVVRRTEAGVVTIRPVPEDLQSIVRSSPESFLARRLMMCEGKTEIGLLLGVEKRWLTETDGRSFAHMGVVLSLGGGTETGSRAQSFSRLGYPVLIFADSDVPLAPSSEDLVLEGIEVAVWPGSSATETRVALDLPWAGFIDLYNLAASYEGERTVCGSVCDVLGVDYANGDGPHSWLETINDETIRIAFAQTAKKRSWFKRVDRGIDLGRLVDRNWDAMVGTDLMQTLEVVKQWVYVDDVAR